MASDEGGAGHMISAEELDRLFDEGEEDVDQYFDTENVQYPGREARTVAVDLPVQVFDALERESTKTGASVQDLIEAWVEERVGAGS
ncbi:MAG: hypothetical protein LBK72_03645 [Bifidobacteriaceae bacterium]|jgi:hypothetical protein|nr:hypothetical protein [Bifidobacteriaceae bacterium]